MISKPKTIIESVESVLALVKESQRNLIIQAVDFEGFKNIVNQKDKMNFDPTAPNFDTAQEIAEGQAIIKAYQAKQKISI
jgi:hypothetical protein